MTDSNGTAIAGACVLLVDPTTGDFYGQENLTDAKRRISSATWLLVVTTCTSQYGCEGMHRPETMRQIYNNAPDLSSAERVSVIAGQTTNNVNCRASIGRPDHGDRHRCLMGTRCLTVAVASQAGDVPPAVISTPLEPTEHTTFPI